MFVKNKIKLIVVIALTIALAILGTSLLDIASPAPVGAQNVPCYFQSPTGSTQKFVASSGCEIEIQSGGTLDVQSGATVDFSSGIDLDGSTLTWDADGDTTAVASFDDVITYTIGVATGRLNVVTGNFKTGNGTPDTTLNGEDAYIEGTFEVDGAVNLDGAVDIDGALTSATGAITIADMLDVDGNLTSATGAISVADSLNVTGAADFVFVQGIDAGATGDSLKVAFTSPIDTADTNVHNGITIDLTIGNSTAGTNTVVAVQIDDIVDDAQVTEKGLNIGDEWDIAIDAVTPIVATAVVWWDDFLGDTVLAQYTEVSGSDAEAVQTIVEEQFGVYQLTSGDVGNTAADLEGVYLSLEWQADQGSLIYEARLHLDTAITTVEICAGFTDDVSTVELPFTNASDTVTAVADDAIMFCFDTGSTTVEWFANGAAAGTEATGIAATGVAPAANVYQTLRIEIDDEGSDCRFYIDGTLVGTLTANCVTNTDLLAPGVVISSGGAAASHVVDVDYIYAGAARD